MVNTFATPVICSTLRRAARLRPLAGALAALTMVGHLGTAHSQDGQGLAWMSTQAAPMWPHWEGRIGVLLDHAVDSSRQSFALSVPAQSGLKLHSAHLLSDYYFAGGFRATAGLVHGPANLPWWPTSGRATAGLNLSLDGVDLSNIPTAGTSTDEANRTVAYVGAGYSTQLNRAKAYGGAWRFNADLGVISLNSGNIARFGRVLQGDQSVEELLRDLRLRPVVKISVNYAF